MVDNIQDRLHQLFVKYAQSLPDKLERINARWQGLQAEWNNGDMQVFHREVHSLSGSAGTYGYQDISVCARQLEQYLKTVLDAQSIRQINVDFVCELLARLQALVELILHHKTIKEDVLEELDSVNPVVNMCIYLVQRDVQSGIDLSESIEHAGYSVQSISDLQALEQAVYHKNPLAIIVNTDFLDNSGILCLQRIQKLHNVSAYVFCIVPNADLLPRLQAIRAGCHGFFQHPVDGFQLTQLLKQKLSMSNREAWRILIVEDSESLAEYYSLILTQAGMVTHIVTDPMQLLNELAGFLPHLILMDIYMPSCTGLELAAVLRHEHRYMKIPIIFLSTEDDRHKQLSAMSMGGDDFLTKPVLPQHLVSAVRARSRRAGMLDYFMTTDGLTGLLNHSSVLGRLDMEIAHARQKKSPLSLVMIDIDHFKKINDTWGHPVGDMVLKKLAALLLVRLRAQDIVGRYGGEEFVLILPGAQAEQCFRICNELREQFAAHRFRSEGQSFSVTFSVGFSCLRGNNDAESLLVEADQMLYQAKHHGRNKVVGFESQNVACD
ncbi:diguanylate cyclase [Legionella sp. CNM-4043-24]|uniref:diguanylate cyclase n=1 Tax=Legionella sp. CNM-4043-24 TaxID=3421646 RepID=UPI00403A99DD